MRTNIEIDDELMDEVLSSGEFKTKRAAVEEGLRLLIRRMNQRQLRKLRGKIDWQGDLDNLRNKRFDDSR